MPQIINMGREKAGIKVLEYKRRRKKYNERGGGGGGGGGVGRKECGKEKQYYGSSIVNG